MARAQAQREVSISTPLGENVLLLQRMHMHEELGRPFQIELELLSENHEIKFADIVGTNVTARIMKAGRGNRYFNGFVSRFSLAGRLGRLSRYRATMVPWLWYLTRTADCRIFQEMSAPEIIEKVFRDLGFTDFDNSLSGSHPKREYCVQYRETAFTFVSRLMEEEGIYYFFQHDDGSHKLVMADSPGSHNPHPGYEKIQYRPPGQQFTEEHIYEWTVEQKVESGKYAHTDFNFETPSTQLLSKSKAMGQYAGSDYEIFDYPGEYGNRGDGDGYAKVRIQELESHQEVGTGKSNACGLCVGSTFNMEAYPRQDQCRQYLVVSTEYRIESDEFDSNGQPAGRGPDYDCTYTAIDAQATFRPQRITPRPMIRGPQTAMVSGKAGEEIWVDKYGRVKLQFHWDRYGKNDETSSCWVRVAQVWAGKGWGGMCIPRMGQEVIVEFLEGDPDRPIITGRVYNAQAMPPYALPANQTQSGLKSRSSKGGGEANFNEIRMEDKKGSEQLYIHAEKNQDIVVENDETHSVGHDRTKTVDRDEKTEIKANRTEDVGSNETIAIGNNRTESVGKNENVNIAENRTHAVGTDETLTIGQNRTQNVGKNDTISVAENRSESVGKDESIAVTGNRGHDIGKNDTLTVGKVLNITAGDEITIVTGQSKLIMKKDGTIELSGKNISLKASGGINIKASKTIAIKGDKITEN